MKYVDSEKDSDVSTLSQACPFKREVQVMPLDMFFSDVTYPRLSDKPLCLLLAKGTSGTQASLDKAHYTTSRVNYT